MTTKPKIAPEKVKEIKEYIARRRETNAEEKYIRRDTIKKFSLASEEWDEYFSNAPKPQSAANPSGSEHLKKAVSQPSGKKVLEKMAQETAEEEAAKTLGLDKEPLPEEAQIIKAKITNDDTLDVSYEMGSQTHSVSDKRKIHDDLKDAFEGLVKHAAILCDQKEVKVRADMFDECIIVNPENLRVSAFHLSGKTNNKVTLTLIKQINQSDRQIVINSPLTDLISEQEPYPFSGYLSKAIGICKDEVIAYLNGKTAKDAQESMEDIPGFLGNKKAEELVESADEEQF